MKGECCDKDKGQKVRKTIPTSQLLEKFRVVQYNTLNSCVRLKSMGQ